MKDLQEGIRLAPKSLPKEWNLKSTPPPAARFASVKFKKLYTKYYGG